jgi:hypothetical protein
MLRGRRASEPSQKNTYRAAALLGYTFLSLVVCPLVPFLSR